jgi:hypothetical protein
MANAADTADTAGYLVKTRRKCRKKSQAEKNNGDETSFPSAILSSMICYYRSSTVDPKAKKVEIPSLTHRPRKAHTRYFLPPVYLSIYLSVCLSISGSMLATVGWMYQKRARVTKHSCLSPTSILHIPPIAIANANANTNSASSDRPPKGKCVQPRQLPPF